MTWFYPSTLLPIPHEDLPPQSGFIGRSLAELRTALRVALGIGSGSCLGRNAAKGSCRGRVVLLSATLAKEIDATAAIVLTEPRYSAERKYQIIVPAFAGRSEAVARHDLLVTGCDWPDVLPTPADHVLLALPATHSVWHDDDIARETEYVLYDDTLREIDRRLCDYFSLTPPDPHDGG
jgi:hypothetical protein